MEPSLGPLLNWLSSKSGMMSKMVLMEASVSPPISKSLKRGSRGETMSGGDQEEERRSVVVDVGGLERGLAIRRPLERDQPTA